MSLDLLSQNAPIQQNEVTPSFPFTFSYPSLFSRWVGSKDYILVFLAPLNLITCAFFLFLYAIRATKVEYLPAAASFMLVIAYTLIVCAAVYAMKVTFRYIYSSFKHSKITVNKLFKTRRIIIDSGSDGNSSCFRISCTPYYFWGLWIVDCKGRCSCCLQVKKSLTFMQAVLTTWGNFLAIYILTVLPREFSSEDKVRILCQHAFSMHINDNLDQGGIHRGGFPPSRQCSW